MSGTSSEDLSPSLGGSKARLEGFRIARSEDWQSFGNVWRADEEYREKKNQQELYNMQQQLDSQRVHMEMIYGY